MTVKKTILCVDDAQSLSIQKLTLETRGYHVLTCNTATEAFDIFSAGGVDLLLSSLELPDTSATELAKRVKALAPQIPVVVLSAHHWELHTDAPIDLFLKKGSCAPADLLERIRLLLVKRRGPRRASPNSLSARAC